MTEQEKSQLITDIKNYLDITFNDQQTDEKIKGIALRGMDYLNRKAGKERNFVEENGERALLFDYCRYARSNKIEDFEKNFKGEIIAMRTRREVEDSKNRIPKL